MDILEDSLASFGELSALRILQQSRRKELEEGANRIFIIDQVLHSEEYLEAMILDFGWRAFRIQKLLLLLFLTSELLLLLFLEPLLLRFLRLSTSLLFGSVVLSLCTCE